MSNAHDIDVPVLIVGAGGAGLTASMLLSDLGVETLTISSALTTSALPKAHVIQQRAMEVFRHAGVADDIYARSAPPQNLAATAWYAGLAGDDPDAGRRIAKQESWGAGGADPEWLIASPCLQANLPQIRLEPVLRAHAESKSPGSIRFGQELVELTQDDSGVTARIQDKSSGETYTVRAQYLLGCDGGRTVGRQVGVELEGMRDILYTASVHFTADLSRWATDPDVLIRWMWPPHVGLMSVLVPMGPERWGPDSEEWVYHHSYPGEDTRLWDDEKIIAGMRDALGIPDFAPEIHMITRWSFEALVAPQMRVGRVFLVGDAAHRHGPTGGLGLTTAIQDSRNIAWKLAAVLAGRAGDELLDTYEQERLPVARRNVARSTENAMHHLAIGGAMGLDPAATPEANWANLRRVWSAAPGDAEFRRRIRDMIAVQSQEFDEHNVEYGYRYESDAVVGDGTPAPRNVDEVRVYVPDTRPGSPVPHAWLTADDDSRLAIVDLIRPGEFILIADGADDRWNAAAADVQAALGVVIRAVRIGHANGDYLDHRLSWLRRRGVSADGAVLVRPDGVVAWRTDGADDPEQSLRDAVSAVLSLRVPVAS
ncbi:FAD-dependent monooxygenase [Agromyces sp. Soil535]|uniref:FAD-dependent monooxygenase n=1 Tax=Agromyces sp. Soil535 TaxID=1736390 RepID=UPI0006FFAD66|nr:FAD-dependent monooxygenase [Agromyces sp. Soil535]KRE31366.1 FAD-binding monooxygenase [Agromyces sp. Soil535]